MRSILLAVGMLLLLFGSPAWADIHDEFRACRYEFFPKIKKMAAIAAANPVERFCLGFAYWRGEGGLKRDPAQSAKWVAQAAAQGHPGAQTVLGYHYEQGHGVRKDYAEAVKWIRKAVDQGYADAMFHLGRLYTTGKGVNKSPRTARDWFRKAAKGGSADGIVALRKEREYELERPAREQFTRAHEAYKAKDYAKAARLYREAAEAGNASARETLATLLRTGQGVPQNFAEALKLIRQAADQGHARAQAQVGFSYQFGEGVPEDWKEAAKWCQRSAEQLDRLGLYCLGQMHQFGIGVPQERERAIKLFDRAEDQGDGQAKFFARWLRVKMNCIGYRDESERDRFVGVCIEPKGLTFANSRERNKWLAVEREKMDMETLRQWGNSSSDYGKGACSAAGGSWGGGGCNGEGGRRFDPGQQDRYGRPLW
jgi:TPR repeat protein